MRNATKKASVIIVTGFLGSGKTTLVNRLLTADHGHRIAVVVNEFGEVGIDHHLLISSDQEVIQMNNGCICCTVRGDLLRSLFQLADRRSQFDTVIIETTGLAEPAPVAQSLYADEKIRREFTLSGVVAMVDAKHVLGQLEQTGEAAKQIMFADLVVLNKTDLVSPEELDIIEDRVRTLNKIAMIHRTKNAELDLNIVLDLDGLDLESRIDDASVAAEGSYCDDGHDHHAHHNHNHHRRHNHLQDIVTVCIVEPAELDGLKVSTWFRAVVAKYGARLMRMKGILNLRADPDQFVFQGVQMEFEGRPGRPWSGSSERMNRLVFIGKDLDEEDLRSGFEQCSFSEAQTGLINPDAFGREVDMSPLTLEQIRYWMRQNFTFAEDVPIVIKEVPCVKPSCPPIETAIVAILPREPPRYFKIQKPISEVTFDHVYDLIENPMPCC